MNPKHIFVHIPKTGGTTLDCAIHGTEWIQNKNVFNYRHIVHETKMSNAGDIFEKANHAKYAEYTIYMMLRHPVDKMISEYFFIRDRKEYFNLLKRKPKNLTEYIKNRQAQNSTLNFLLGKRFYPNSPATATDLEKVKNAIETLPIHVGIFEEFEKSLEYFKKTLDLKIPNKINVKRVTLNRPTIEEVAQETKELIVESNPLDLELYNFCKAKLDQSNIKSKNYKISKDRYAYIMKYTERFNLFVLFIPKSEFLQRNAAYFKDLNFFLHQKVAFTQGKKYVTLFNRILTHDLAKLVPALKSELDAIAPTEETDDPLKNTETLGKFISKYSVVKKASFNSLMKFNLSSYPQELLHLEEAAKPSFLSRLFGKG